jgi:hypothetical protein
MIDGGICQPRDLPVLPPLGEGANRPHPVAAVPEAPLEEPVPDVVVVDEVVEVAAVVIADDGEVLEVVEAVEVVEVVDTRIDETRIDETQIDETQIDETAVEVEAEAEVGDADDVTTPDAHLERAPGLPEVVDPPAPAPAAAAPSAPEAGITPDVLELELRAVDAALARLDRGDYGRCGVCNLVLDDAVMAADPTVAVCPAHVGLRPALAS